jgi:pantetheine-phosphate adenylyltransferase
MITALCPGSYDPITMGHLDIIERSAAMFDRCHVTVFVNAEKHPLFTVAERLDMAREATQGIKNVVVRASEGLLSEYARANKIKVVIKGLRAVSDFELEFIQAQMNKHLNPDFETLFMMTQPAYAFLSSSIVKEVARWRGDLTGLVPPSVARRLQAKFEGA